ncbi:MAG: site-specific DNA-methyltransferase [Candidatus Loosdrechtia sp.]|uniref:site-specific DNA-methyltransferase n=1 Tax=Candidatus Loosdrechtia sp. TaxID=3101272 RepID=UPI003A6A00AD|nr:MAG: site-specific DNA-methyltransferase [Candidatus Jettenia sp. AMX2]
MAKKKSEKKPIEQYEHKGKERINNPPVGLVTPETDKETGKKKYSYDPHIDPALQFDSQRSQIEKIINNGLNAETLEEAKAALHELNKRQAPYLNWAGKAEHTSFEIPTVSLHVHERIDPRTIIETVRKRNGQSYVQLSLFKTKEENPPLREAIEFYKHKHNWTNRLIAGDSLLVMNSLVEKEGLSGKVQMIYFDPPYGIKYGSNFQPFVNKRDVKDGKDEDLTQEPEMIKAFKDTWELGIHSYLAYLRDRLLLARELLNESGSIFVQISDENVHLVRCLMDEVFGKENFISLIVLKKSGTTPSNQIANVSDYLIWYAKSRELVKFRRLFWEKNLDVYSKKDENEEAFFYADLQSAGETKTDQKFTFGGKEYLPRLGYHWSTSVEGLERLSKARRIHLVGNNLRYKRYLKDFPLTEITHIWDDLSGVTGNIYVVQTPNRIVERCILITTDPGDLVFDPTCGSGTTAYIAEQWGRRWITCDTSRVAITLAKQRLMTALFDYYELAHPDEGVGSGFRYKTVPHITLKSIANNEPPAQETLYDQPLLDKSRARVTGPFTVEAVPASTVKPLSDIDTAGAGFKPVPAEDIARSGETLRQAEWRDELLKCGIRGKNNQKILFSRVEPLPGTRWLHAEAETKPNDLGADTVRDPDILDEQSQRVVISFGSEYAPLEQRQVSLAIEEAQRLVPKPGIIVFASFQFDPEAAKDIDETNWPGTTLLKVQMNTDLLTDDLKKKRASNESFWLIGQPDVKLVKMKEGKDKGKYLVEVHGFDYYNTKTGIIESGGTERIALWMLDTDYDGRSLFPRQVFFPMSGEKDGWSRLAKNLKAEIDEGLIEAYRGTISLPFESDKYKRIAVKIVDDRGIESLKVMEIV